MTSPSLWKRTSAVREVSGMALRVVRDNHGHWRWTVSRPGMKPHLNGLRTTEAAAKREARRFAIKSAFESTQGEQQ